MFGVRVASCCGVDGSGVSHGHADEAVNDTGWELKLLTTVRFWLAGTPPFTR